MFRNMVKREVEIVESADDPVGLIKNSFAPARVKEVRVTERLDNKKVAVVTVDSRDRGVAIGREGRTAERTRLLAKRYFQIDNVIVN